MIDPDTREFTLVRINLLLGNDEKPFAKPDRAECFRGDAVRFQSPYPFTVEEKENGDWPFNDPSPLIGVEETGLYAVEATVSGEAVLDHPYPYTLTVDGHTVDPEIVVKPDPTKH